MLGCTRAFARQKAREAALASAWDTPALA